MNKKLIAPIVTAAAMLATSIGTTFALFSSKASSRIDISAGRVAVNYDATVSKALSRYEDLEPWDAIANKTETHAATFENGSTADISVESTGAVVTLDRLTPMDMIELKVGATNASNINIKFRYFIKASGDLLPALDLIVDGSPLTVTGSSLEFYSAWSSVMTPNVESLFEKNIGIYFPDHGDEFDNQYQEKTAVLEVGVEAVQGNAEVHNPVDPEPLDETEEIHSKKPSAAGKSVNMESKTGSQSYVVPFEACKESAEELVLTIIPEEEPTAEVPAGKDVLPYDIHIDGIKEDNTAEIEARIGIGQGKTNVQVFHNGAEIESKYVEDEGSVYFKATSFSPYDVVFDAARQTGFGFYNSYLVDEGLETEHWVHEISTVEEYRNIGIFSYKAEDFKTEYEITSAHFCDEKTEYVLLNDIDCFGVSPWYDVENARYYELSEGKTIGDFVFTGVLNGNNNTIKNIKATAKMGQKVSTDECDIGGLFDAVHNITIKDLKVSNVVVDNAEAKPGAVIACGYPQAAGLGASSLHFENVVVDESCAVYGKQGSAGFLGYARNDASDISFKNCVNGADIICSGSNLGGFLGSNSGSSAGGRTIVFDGCENKGNISGQQLLGGFAGTQTNGCTWIIKDSTNSGDITSSLGSTVGLINGQISNNDSISYTNVTNSGFIYVPENKVSTIKNSGKEFTPSAEPTNIHYENEPVEATKGDLANQFVKKIVDTVDIGISFNATTHAIEFSNTENLPAYTRVVLDVNLGAVDKFDLQTSKMISSGGNTALTQTKNTIEEISAKEISRVGWIKPTATTPTGTFGNSGKNYDWYEDFMIPFSERDNPAYSTGYHEDELGGYYTIDNKDAVTSFGQIFKLWTVAEWNVYVYDGGTVVGHGYWRTPGAPDGRQTYFTNVYQAA